MRTLLEQHEQVRLLLIPYNPVYTESVLSKTVVYAKLKSRFDLHQENGDFFYEDIQMRVILNDYTVCIQNADHEVFKAVYGCVLSPAPVQDVCECEFCGNPDKHCFCTADEIDNEDCEQEDEEHDDHEEWDWDQWDEDEEDYDDEEDENALLL